MAQGIPSRVGCDVCTSVQEPSKPLPYCAVALLPRISHFLGQLLSTEYCLPHPCTGAARSSRVSVDSSPRSVRAPEQPLLVPCPLLLASFVSFMLCSRIGLRNDIHPLAARALHSLTVTGGLAEDKESSHALPVPLLGVQSLASFLWKQSSLTPYVQRRLPAPFMACSLS